MGTEVWGFVLLRVPRNLSNSLTGHQGKQRSCQGWHVSCGCVRFRHTAQEHLEVLIPEQTNQRTAAGAKEPDIMTQHNLQ